MAGRKASNVAVTMLAVMLMLACAANAAVVDPLTALEGRYNGTAQTSDAVQRARCELHTGQNDIYGTLRVGDEFFEVTGGTLSGDVVELKAVVNGSEVLLKGTFKDGHLNITSSTVGTLVMEKVPDRQ